MVHDSDIIHDSDTIAEHEMKTAIRSLNVRTAIRSLNVRTMIRSLIVDTPTACIPPSVHSPLLSTCTVRSSTSKMDDANAMVFLQACLRQNDDEVWRIRRVEVHLPNCHLLSMFALHAKGWSMAKVSMLVSSRKLTAF